MAILTVGDVHRAVFVCSLGNQFSQNVRHFQVTSIVNGPATDVAITSALSTRAAGGYRPLLSVQARYEGVKTQRIIPTQENPVVSTTDAGQGQEAGDALPPQIAGLIRYTSNTFGRRGRGRMYIPFMAEGYNDPFGHPSQGALVAMDALGEVMNGVETFALAGSTVDITFGRPHSISGVFIPWVTAEPANRWATQRRRSFIGKSDSNPLV